jgi:hypothetical protein
MVYYMPYDIFYKEDNKVKRKEITALSIALGKQSTVADLKGKVQ